MPSEKHDHLELTFARDGLPRSKSVLALSAMIALAVVVIGSLPINDSNAQSRQQHRYQYGYFYRNQGDQTKYSFGQHHNYSLLEPFPAKPRRMHARIYTRQFA